MPVGSAPEFIFWGFLCVNWTPLIAGLWIEEWRDVLFSFETTVQLVCLSPAYIRSNQIMGWGEKAIEIRSVETGHLDGVFMHKRAQRLKFLCERNDKVRLQYISVFVAFT